MFFFENIFFMISVTENFTFKIRNSRVGKFYYLKMSHNLGKSNNFLKIRKK